MVFTDKLCRAWFGSILQVPNYIYNEIYNNEELFMFV